MGELQVIRQDFDRLKAAVVKNELQQAQSLLSQLKVKLIKLAAQPQQSDASSQAARVLAREVLEQAIFLSVKLKDDDAFQRNYAQLQEYYVDSRKGDAASSLQDLIVGLNLLRLLVQNSIAEFHTELELLPPKVQRSLYVAQATQLEQWLMEGAYNKVLDARKAAPDPAYAYFLDKLQSTIRDEIAGCSEQAYLSLSIEDATKLMMFSSKAELLDYAQQREWTLEDGRLILQLQDDEKINDVPAVELIQHALTYARELERIV